MNNKDRIAHHYRIYFSRSTQAQGRLHPDKWKHMNLAHQNLGIIYNGQHIYQYSVGY